MNHLSVATIVLPALAGMLLVFLARRDIRLQRAVSLAASAALVVLCALLLDRAGRGVIQVYELGAWPAPFGIVLVLDQLSAYLLLITSVLALCALAFAIRGDDRQGKNFHALFQFQLMGLNIAFLTGDLFNLFVAFEVLLIASYGLLLHGGGEARTRAGIHYVVINLAGSALFLIGVGLIYGVTGALNMADVAAKAAALPPQDAPLLAAGGLILLAVFAIKAAVLPLYFWLPSAYSAATPAVAALFAVMTKVGVYAIIRVYTLIFSPEAGPVAGIAQPWLLPAALATLSLGMLGALAASGLRRLSAYLVVASVGTLLIGVGLFSQDSLAAALYYLPHSTFVGAAMFLLAGLIAEQRGGAADTLTPGPALAQPALLGALFFIVAVGSAGLPPLSGFLGKLLILDSALADPRLALVWAVVLGTSLLGVIALSRAGSLLFWKLEDPAGSVRAGALALAPVAALVTLLVAMTLWAGPLSRYGEATARQLLSPQGYMDAVLATPRALEYRHMGKEAP